MAKSKKKLLEDANDARISSYVQMTPEQREVVDEALKEVVDLIFTKIDSNVQLVYLGSTLFKHAVEYDIKGKL